MFNGRLTLEKGSREILRSYVSISPVKQ